MHSSRQAAPKTRDGGPSSTSRQPSPSRPGGKEKEIDSSQLTQKIRDLEMERKNAEKERVKIEKQRKKELADVKKKLQKEVQSATKLVRRNEMDINKLASFITRVDDQAAQTRVKKSRQSDQMDDKIGTFITKRATTETSLNDKVVALGEARGRLAHIQFAQKMLEQGIIIPTDGTSHGDPSQQQQPHQFVFEDGSAQTEVHAPFGTFEAGPTDESETVRADEAKERLMDENQMLRQLLQQSELKLLEVNEKSPEKSIMSNPALNGSTVVPDDPSPSQRFDTYDTASTCASSCMPKVPCRFGAVDGASVSTMARELLGARMSVNNAFPVQNTAGPVGRRISVDYLLKPRQFKGEVGRWDSSNRTTINPNQQPRSAVDSPVTATRMNSAYSSLYTGSCLSRSTQPVPSIATPSIATTSNSGYPFLAGNIAGPPPPRFSPRMIGMPAGTYRTPGGPNHSAIQSHRHPFQNEQVVPVQGQAVPVQSIPGISQVRGINPMTQPQTLLNPSRRTPACMRTPDTSPAPGFKYNNLQSKMPATPQPKQGREVMLSQGQANSILPPRHTLGTNSVNAVPTDPSTEILQATEPIQTPFEREDEYLFCSWMPCVTGCGRNESEREV